MRDSRRLCDNAVHYDSSTTVNSEDSLHLYELCFCEQLRVTRHQRRSGCCRRQVRVKGGLCQSKPRLSQYPVSGQTPC